MSFFIIYISNNMNNFIALDNNDIILYNKVQSKIFKYFINHHKNYDFKIDENANEASIKYCKNFKFNVCLCYRQKINLNNNYSNIYNCPNNKRILYNSNNFDFLKPIILNIDNNKTYPINIFNFYRQEYLPFIIHEKFTKYKTLKSKLNFFNKNKLRKYFNHIQQSSFYFTFLKYTIKQFYKQTKNNKIIHIEYNNNAYYNQLIDIFDNDNKIIEKNDNNYNKIITIEKNDNNKIITIEKNDNNNNKQILIDKNDIGTQTEQPVYNYAFIIAVILNEYSNLIGDYNDLIISMICNK